MPEPADAIHRELILPAPPERVWAALTEPEGLSQWFGHRATVDLRPGGTIMLYWDEPDGHVFANGGIIEVVDPPRRFVFRWRPHVDAAHLATAGDITTLVAFTLEPHPEGTLLELVESGFSALPPEVRGPAFGGNSRGWTLELGELSVYLAR